MLQYPIFNYHTLKQRLATSHRPSFHLAARDIASHSIKPILTLSNVTVLGIWHRFLFASIPFTIFHRTPTIDVGLPHLQGRTKSDDTHQKQHTM